MPGGTLVGGSYTIKRKIGSGGFGVTYEAEDIRLGTTVAIKEYYPQECAVRADGLTVRPRTDADGATFDWGRKSFLQEARTLARFRHPSIVDVILIFEEFGTVYMVMAYESGPSLEKWLTDLGRLPTQAELDELAIPLLQAIEQMHSQGFVHRDIAPDNIIVRPDGPPVLLDFGAARRATADGSQAITGMVKAGYSPPEQYAADGLQQGPWSDCYAFGATFYRAVTGVEPEEAPLRGMEDRLQPATTAAAGPFRASFLAAIDECLKLTREDRPQSVAQLARMLFAESAADIIPAQSAEPSEIATTSTRWNVLWFAAMVLVLGAAGFATSRYIGWQEKGLKRIATEIERSTEEEERRAAAAEAARKKAEEEETSRAHREKAASEWEAIKGSDDIAAVERFLSLYADTPAAEPARTRHAELKRAAEHEASAAAAWNAISASTDVAELEKFIAEFPTTRAAELARTRVAQLNREQSLLRERLSAECTPTRLADEALHACSDLIARFPENARAYAVRGDHYRRRSQYDLAIADLTKSLELDAQDAFARSRRGTAHGRAGRTAEAQADFAYLLSMTPATAGDFEARGEAHWIRNELDAAVTAYTKAIELDPAFALAYVGRAIVLDKQQHYDRVIVDTNKAISLDAQFAEAYNQRGIAQGASRQSDRAIADYTKAIELFPQFVHALSNLCFEYEKARQYDRAMANCNKAIEYDPKFANGYTNRGVVHVSRGQLNLAFADFNKVVELKPKDANAYTNRGVVYFQMGDRNRAIADFRTALGFDPNHKDARGNLQKLGVQP